MLRILCDHDMGKDDGIEKNAGVGGNIARTPRQIKPCPFLASRIPSCHCNGGS
jgi:hypothetical protein